VLTKLFTLVCMLLGVLIGAGAQTGPTTAPESAAASASQTTAGRSAAAPRTHSFTGGQQREATGPTVHASAQRTGRHFLGLPLKWVIVGVAAVATIITIAAIMHNRSPPGPCHYNPGPCP